MKWRQRLLTGMSVALLLGVAVGVRIATRPKLEITSGTFHVLWHRFGQAASDPELAAMVGQPPGDYSTGKRFTNAAGGMASGTDQRANEIASVISKAGMSKEAVQQAIQSICVEDRRLDVWFTSNQALVVIRDKSDAIKSIVLHPCSRLPPCTFREKCEDWLHTKIYGDD